MDHVVSLRFSSSPVVVGQFLTLYYSAERKGEETRSTREKKTLIYGMEWNGTEGMVKLEEAQKIEAKSRHVFGYPNCQEAL